MRWMATTALALAGATLAHTGAGDAAIAAEAGEAVLRAPEAGTALWIGADRQHVGEYPFSLALGDAGDEPGAAPWLGRELRVYADGQARGRARPLRRIAGSDLGCSEPDRLAFAPGDEAPALGEHGAWLADFDLNPERRLQRRAATLAEREELLAELMAMAVPDRVERPGAGAADPGRGVRRRRGRCARTHRRGGAVRARGRRSRLAPQGLGLDRVLRRLRGHGAAPPSAGLRRPRPRRRPRLPVRGPAVRKLEPPTAAFRRRGRVLAEAGRRRRLLRPRPKRCPGRPANPAHRRSARPFGGGAAARRCGANRGRILRPCASP